MSYLIALIFDDQFKGEEARAALHRMAGEGLLEMNDTVFMPGSQTERLRFPRRTMSWAVIRRSVMSRG
jgi:uncharacterized membrane protein